MPYFYLVRHGNNDYLGNALAGRLPGVCLNEKGRAEAAWLAEVLAKAGIQRIFSSPLDRCRQTAEPLAQRLGLSVEISDEIVEINFGDWTGQPMAELEASKPWRRFNTFRSGTRAPNGETVLEVQCRMIRFLEKLSRDEISLARSVQTFAIFSHGDPIRAVLCYYLGIPLDLMNRLEVSPGSYSILRVEDGGAEILAINRLPA